MDPFDFAKIPDEKTAAAATSATLLNSAGVIAPQDLDEDEEDPNAERLELGLSETDGTGRKRKSAGGGGPKIKKSRDEVFAEELERVQAKFEEILVSLSSSAPATLVQVNKLDRSVAKKMDDSKKAGLFDVASQMESLLSDLQLIKEAIRTTGVYLPASGLPNKKHEQAFLQAMGNLSVSFRQRFSDSVRDHYLHVNHTKDQSARVCNKSFFHECVVSHQS